MSGIRDAGFEDTTPVQEQTFVHTLGGRDVTVQSQTGTGKTAAFLISLFQLMTEDERYKGAQALIIAPTRELVVQIEEEAKLLGGHCGLKVGSIYGGVGYDQQLRMLEQGVDVIAGTPGRLLDLNQSRKLDFRNVGLLVIDEADRLFDMGFYPDIKKMLQKMRPREQRMTMLFSATLSVRVRNLSWEHMNNPAEIAIEPESMTVDKVEQQLFHVTRKDKFRLLLGLLKQEAPQNAIIFCNTKREVEDVSLRLRENGYPTEFIIGDLPQKKRLRIIEGIKSGETPVLVATDVAARGLHVNDLDLVVNYDLPEDPENYVHRIGRTARAGKSGRAISLACERFVYGLEPIEQLIDQKIPSVIPAVSDYAEDVTGGRRLQHTANKASRDRGHDRGSGDSRTPGRRGRPRSSAERKGREHPRSGGASRDTSRRAPASVRRKDAAAAHEGSTKPGRDPVTTARKSATRKPQDVQRDADLDERLRYYREKYGEDFVPDERRGGEHQEAGSRPGGSAPGGSAPGGSAPDGAGRKRGSRGRRTSEVGGSRDRGAESAPEKGSGSDGNPGKKNGVLGFLGRLFGKGSS